jgi:DNA-binding PadR family transcriptional regulator
MEILQELVEDGWLQVQIGELNNGLAVRLYSLTSAGRDALRELF